MRPTMEDRVGILAASVQASLPKYRVDMQQDIASDRVCLWISQGDHTAIRHLNERDLSFGDLSVLGGAIRSCLDEFETPSHWMAL